MSDDFEDFLPDPPSGDFDPDIPLDQAGIDALFGDVGTPVEPKQGLRALIESDVVSHERLPMLEVVFDRMVRIFATSMRNLTSDAIDVNLEEVSSVRFGDFMGHVMLPAMIGVFRVEEWENYGLITVESGLIYSVVDALLGGRRGGDSMMIDGRGFTTIETDLVGRMLRHALADMSSSMAPITPTTVSLERIETSPRFATIAGSTNICAVATFRVDMDERGGRFSILLPYASIEPVRHLLGQRFMGEKLGHDNIWESHMANEIRKTEVTLDVVLGERMLPLAQVRDFDVGQTISLFHGPDEPLELQCGGIPLGRAQIGQRSNNVAVRLVSDIAKGVQP
ncbi:flagellar motor switch protein FliM [Stakelama pacifica]|uniref:Flagellar motor switch protein FliM n=1 Tax=Stakelama pacifica TaxID=517720 RepID=A0A4R6FIF7_9SPHN|nr:flagellar motor switch protein FliM [Stakelama pacifica]MAW98521.1 flagellar motor switch protein FliM [Sphingomonas sp.]TDN81166.1 flagellar motor switch protein FliM [Stakelama pacifica]GGO96948.1 flagellar motor switch protein FliM [Stakelama pacifica]